MLMFRRFLYLGVVCGACMIFDYMHLALVTLLFGLLVIFEKSQDDAPAGRTIPETIRIAPSQRDRILRLTGFRDCAYAATLLMCIGERIFRRIKVGDTIYVRSRSGQLHQFPFTGMVQNWTIREVAEPGVVEWSDDVSASR